VKQRVLVVEDNPLNRELLCDWLEAEGYEVQSVEDLSAGMRSVEACNPGAVLLDVQLGGEDGLALAAWMRKQPSLCRIPVIAVSAHAMVTEQSRFLEAGCNSCVPKPINFTVLRKELDHWLQSTKEPKLSS
jgi:CheY-like chemotaxis protein